MSEYAHLIWHLYCLFVITSFFWFARSWLRHPEKWHIGFLSTSYAGACLLIAANGHISEEWSMLLGVIVMALGIAGLMQYWIKKK